MVAPAATAAAGLVRACESRGEAPECRADGCGGRPWGAGRRPAPLATPAARLDDDGRESIIGWEGQVEAEAELRTPIPKTLSDADARTAVVWAAAGMSADMCGGSAQLTHAAVRK